jgi:aspartate ammonia-lyase
VGHREARRRAGQQRSGGLSKEKLALIEKAAQAVREGKYQDQFKTDWYQGGAGRRRT